MVGSVVSDDELLNRRACVEEWVLWATVRMSASSSGDVLKEL